MKNLNGTEKQVKWALDIRKDMLEAFDKYTNLEDETLKETIEIIRNVKETVENETDAKWFIDNREMIGMATIVDENDKVKDIKLLDLTHDLFSTIGRRARHNLVGAIEKSIR